MDTEILSEDQTDAATKSGSGVGAIGAIVAAMGCINCFPALGALGASLGLGWIEHYEGFVVRTIMPIFVVVALVANLYSFYRHRIVWRGVLSLIGPVLVMAKLYLFWSASWSNGMFYVGLAFMICVSIYDVVSPPLKRCPAPPTND